jgi:hypothetical protein
MDILHLERSTKLHRAYAEIFKQNFARALGRALTQTEIDTLESATLCFSGMRLEILERRSQGFRTPLDAEEEYRFLQVGVQAHCHELRCEFEAAARELGVATQPTSDESLLVFEERLLTDAKQAGQP